jgi:hypothetical protein
MNLAIHCPLFQLHSMRPNFDHETGLNFLLLIKITLLLLIVTFDFVKDYLEIPKRLLVGLNIIL